MLDSIIAASLRNRALVLVASILVAITGLWTALNTPIDVLPDLDRPVVSVLTETHGLVPEDVERLVTWPIEQVLNGASGVFRVRSTTGMGMSVVNVEFDWGTDVYRDRQIVAEKLQLAIANLPDDVTPTLAPVASIMGQVQLIGFRSTPQTDTTTAEANNELRRLIDRDIVPRLKSLSGIAQLAVIGGQPTELQVTVEAAKLRAFDVTLTEVRDAVSAANVAVAGTPLQIGERAPLVTLSGRLEAPEQLASAVVKADPTRPVTIRDLGTVSFGPAAVPVGDAGIDGNPGVIVIVTKQPGVDTLDLTERVTRELEQLTAELPENVTVIPDLFRQATFIERAVDNVLVAVRDGAIFVLIVLLLFLGNFRTTLITIVAIPMSIATTALVFALTGETINTMTLGGLAVAIGTLVDDAIVDVENVFRRLHQNAHAEHPKSKLQVVFEASREIRKPVFYGTLLVTVVFVPLFFLSGIEGRLFTPIGSTFIISIIASLLVAMTLTPVMCYWLLGNIKPSANSPDYGGRVVQALRNAVEPVVRVGIRHSGSIVALVAALGLAAGFVLYHRGSTFLPEFNEGSAQVNLFLPPDTGLPTSNQFGQRLANVTRAVDGVLHVARRTGRASGDEHAMPISVTEAIVTFDPESTRSREAILEEIRHRLEDAIPGVPSATEQPLAHLLSHMLSGVAAQVAIKIYGPDLDVLRSTAERVEHALESIEGVRDLFVEPQVQIDQIEVSPRRDSLARLGIGVDQVGATVELAMGGEMISQFNLGRITYPIKLRLAETDRDSVEDLGELLLPRDGDHPVRIADIADVGIVKTPNLIQRENGSRRIAVQHNIGGRALGAVVADVERALEPIRAELASSSGYSIRLSGQFEAQAEAQRLIGTLTVFALAAMMFILWLHFRSMRIATLVLGSRVIALLGAVVLILATGQVLSIATLVGLIALLGVATRNAILLVDHTLHLVRDEGRAFTPDTLVEAAKERVVPVMMTALTSGIGLLPLALAAGEPGREILYPVATVIIGGLVSNTLLDFLVMPGLLWTLGRDEVMRLSDLPDEPTEAGEPELS